MLRPGVLLALLLPVAGCGVTDYGADRANLADGGAAGAHTLAWAAGQLMTEAREDLMPAARLAWAGCYLPDTGSEVDLSDCFAAFNEPSRTDGFAFCTGADGTCVIDDDDPGPYLATYWVEDWYIDSDLALERLSDLELSAVAVEPAYATNGLQMVLSAYPSFDMPPGTPDNRAAVLAVDCCAIVQAVMDGVTGDFWSPTTE